MTSYWLFRRSFLQLVLWASLVSALDDRLPPSIKICRRSMILADRNACLKQSINELMPVIAHGYPSLRLPELDPYNVGEQRFSVSEGIISFKIKLKESKTLGISKGRVTDVKSKFTQENFGVILDVNFPYLGAQGDYKGDTRLNRVKFQSKGNFKLDIFKARFKIKFLGKIKPKNGQNFVDIHTVKISDVALEDLKVDISGLFPEPELDKFAVEFINQNWKALYDQLVPRAITTFEPIYLTIAKSVFDTVPLDELMPE